MSNDSQIMLLSIRPRFVQQILSGDKTVELRRTKPVVDVGQLVAIYSTLPAGAIVATARVARVEHRAKQDLWEERSPALGVSEDEYNEYFAGRSHAVGVHLDSVAPLESPVSLSQMRLLGVPNPPQQWLFLRSSEWGRHLSLVEPAAA